MTGPRPYVLTVALGLALIAAFNYTVDPGRHWRPAAFQFTHNWPAGQEFLTDDDFDERPFRVAHMAVIERPDVIVFGSSRAFLIDSEMFPAATRSYNASVPGATIEDFAALWQALKDQDKTPRYLILLADPWIFNANSGQIRWRGNLALYEKFLRGSSHGASPRLWIEAARQRWRSFYDGLCELLSFKLLVAAAKTAAVRLRSGWPAQKMTFSPLGSTAQIGWRADGAVEYPVDKIKPKTLEAIRASAAEYGEQEDVYSISRYQVDGRALSVLDALIDDVAAHGTKLLVIAPPYHQVVLEKLAARPKYAGVLPLFSSLLKRGSRDGARFPVCDALDPRLSRCSEVEFMDGMHMLPGCAAKVLQRCLEPLPEWQPLRSIPQAVARARRSKI